MILMDYVKLTKLSLYQNIDNLFCVAINFILLKILTAAEGSIRWLWRSHQDGPGPLRSYSLGFKFNEVPTMVKFPGLMAY